MNAKGGGEGEKHPRHYPLLLFIFIGTVFIRAEQLILSNRIVVKHVRLLNHKHNALHITRKTERVLFYAPIHPYVLLTR